MTQAVLEALGQRIALRRTQMSISQTGLASLAGLSRQTISLVETGRVAAKISTLLLISDVLDVHVTDLLEGL